MSGRRAIIVGGGAAGFFAAITAAEAAPDLAVTVLERGPEFLAKVRISGGGRCNVTHACFEPAELIRHYPRGGRELRGPFHRFQPRDTVEWFARRGVELKTEADGRMFPVTDRSATIVDCLVAAARKAGVELRTGVGADAAVRRPAGGFAIRLVGGGALEADRLMLATGGCRGPAGGLLAEGLGHTLVPPVPSLFTFEIPDPGLKALAGLSAADAEVSVPGTALRARGPLLVTHWGLSGPAVLRLSAWGARDLHARDYRFAVQVNWLADWSAERLAAEIDGRRREQGARRVANGPLGGIPGRLWEWLVRGAGLDAEARWSNLSRPATDALVRRVRATSLDVTGKSLNKDEFVTCGGVRLADVDFRTLESRVCPGLHFGGELLDIDGVTGGFNFQAAWTTGWLAGQAMAGG